MKVLIGAVAVLILMIGAPLAYANQADTEKEAGIASDAQGRPCTFGPSHTECYDQSLKRTNKGALTDYQSGFLQGVHDMIHNHFIILWTKYSNEYANGYNHGLTAAYNATLR